MRIVNQRGDPTWGQSLTKLSIFNLTEYKRIIYFDADGLVMKNMDHLFSLPPTPIAMPRAYWLDQPFFSDHITVIEPSERRLEELLAQARKTGTIWCSRGICLAGHYIKSTSSRVKAVSDGTGQLLLRPALTISSA